MPIYDCGDPECAPCKITFRADAPKPSLRSAEAVLLEEVRRIVDDYFPDRDADAPLALAEMREALQAAISRVAEEMQE